MQNIEIHNKDLLVSFDVNSLFIKVPAYPWEFKDHTQGSIFANYSPSMFSWALKKRE